MLKSYLGLVGLAFLASTDLQAQEKSLAQKNLEWHYNADGTIDSCKNDKPSPFANVPPDARAEFDKAVEDCHRRKATAINEDLKRREDMISQQAAERAAARRLAEAHTRYLEEHHLTQVSVIDLQADGKNMVGGHVVVTGVVRILSEDMIGLYTSVGDVNGARLDLSEATPQSRRRIFSQCSDIYNLCQIEIAGTVAFNEHVLVQVE